MNHNVKVVKLQISRKQYQLIEAKNEEEVNLVADLNRDFYRFQKSEQRLKSRSISHDRLIDDSDEAYKFRFCIIFTSHFHIQNHLNLICIERH